MDASNIPAKFRKRPILNVSKDKANEVREGGRMLPPVIAFCPTPRRLSSPSPSEKMNWALLAIIVNHSQADKFISAGAKCTFRRESEYNEAALSPAGDTRQLIPTLIKFIFFPLFVLDVQKRNINVLSSSPETARQSKARPE